ncbi:MAG TPA: hypothetical protein VEJ87_12565 [Acidimicrobiales bacterium]|nr:hypothetical protein [Acidimicrobiales bacterium]
MRRVIFSAGALLVSAGVVGLGAATPAGAAGPVKATGSVLCGISSGSGTLSPGLTPLGTAGGVKITFAAKFSTGNCSSNVTTPPGDSVVGGSLTGSGFYNAPASSLIGSSCAAFHGADVVGKIVVKIDWVTSGAPIAATKVVYQNNPSTVAGSPFDTITLKAPPAPGTAIKHGSFSVPPGLPPNTTQLTTSIPAPPCGAGPYSNFNITGGMVQM